MLSDGYVTARRVPEDILLKKETEPDCKVHLFSNRFVSPDLYIVHINHFNLRSSCCLLIWYKQKLMYMGMIAS